MGNRYFGNESEATYGTVPAAGANTQWLDIESETVLDGLSNEFVVPETIRYTTPDAARLAMGKYKHTGGVTGYWDLHSGNWLLVLKGLLGDPTSASDGTLPYTHTFVPYQISDTIESLGLRVGPVIEDGGAEKELTCNGVGVRSMTWSWAAGEKVQVDADFLIRSVDKSAVSTPAYADDTTAFGSAVSRAMTGNEVYIYRDISGDGDPTDETPEAKCISGSITISNPFDDDAFFCSSRELGGLYLDGQVDITGELTLLWDDWEEFELFWGADGQDAPHATTYSFTNTPMVIQFGGETAGSDAEIEDGKYYGLDFDLPKIAYETISAGITTTEKPIQTITWRAFYSASDGYAVQVVAENKLTDVP